MLPVLAPRPVDHRVAVVPDLTKAGQLALGFLRRGRPVNLLEVGGHRLAVLVADILQRGAHLVDDAQLHLGLGIHRLDGLGKTREPVHAGDEQILNTAILELRPDLQPEHPRGVPAAGGGHHLLQPADRYLDGSRQSDLRRAGDDSRFRVVDHPRAGEVRDGSGEGQGQPRGPETDPPANQMQIATLRRQGLSLTEIPRGPMYLWRLWGTRRSLVGLRLFGIKRETCHQ